MSKRRTYEERLHIDMPFGEALERFIGVDPKEVEANVAKAKKKKPPGGTRVAKRKHGPPGGSHTKTKTNDSTVANLRDRRTRRRNKGY